MRAGEGLLGADGGFVGAVGVADAAGVLRRLVVEVAEGRQGGKGRQVLFYGMTEVAVFLVERCRRAGGEGEQQFFAAEFALCAVGKAVGEDLVEPVFHQAGEAVPGEGKLPDDDVGARERGLFGGDVDAVVGVEVVQFADFCLRQGALDVFEDGGICDGVFQVGVAGDDEDVWHGVLLVGVGGQVGGDVFGGEFADFVVGFVRVVAVCGEDVVERDAVFCVGDDDAGGRGGARRG